jgi:hypothetical protein
MGAQDKESSFSRCAFSSSRFFFFAASIENLFSLPFTLARSSFPIAKPPLVVSYFSGMA